jgi:hypothetical protein
MGWRWGSVPPAPNSVSVAAAAHPYYASWPERIYHKDETLTIFRKSVLILASIETSITRKRQKLFIYTRSDCGLLPACIRLLLSAREWEHFPPSRRSIIQKDSLDRHVSIPDFSGLGLFVEPGGSQGAVDVVTAVRQVDPDPEELCACGKHFLLCPLEAGFTAPVC